MSLLELLRSIRKQPVLYLGEPARNRVSIWHLRSFLVGYQCGILNRSAKEGDDILDSLTFWICTRYGVADGSIDWAGHLWDRSGRDDEAAFRLFFDLFEEYIRDREQLGKDAIKARFMQMLEQRKKSA